MEHKKDDAMSGTRSQFIRSLFGACAAIALLGAAAEAEVRPVGPVTAEHAGPSAVLLAQDSETMPAEANADEEADTKSTPGDGLTPVTQTPKGVPTPQLPAQAIKPTPATVPTTD